LTLFSTPFSPPRNEVFYPCTVLAPVARLSFLLVRVSLVPEYLTRFMPPCSPVRSCLLLPLFAVSYIGLRRLPVLFFCAPMDHSPLNPTRTFKTFLLYPDFPYPVNLPRSTQCFCNPTPTPNHGIILPVIVLELRD